MHGTLAKVFGSLMAGFMLAHGIAMLISPRRWHKSRWGCRGGAGAEYLDDRFVVLVYRVMGVILMLSSAFIIFRLIVDG